MVPFIALNSLLQKYKFAGEMYLSHENDIMPTILIVLKMTKLNETSQNVT